MEKDNVFDLTEARKRKQTRYTEDEQAIIDTINAKHPAGRKAAKTEYNGRPELVTKHIQEQLERLGYPSDVVDGVRSFYEIVLASYPELSPTEVSDVLKGEYRELCGISYEDNLKNSEAASEKARQNYEAGRVAFTIITDHNAVITPNTPRPDLRIVDDTDE